MFVAFTPPRRLDALFAGSVAAVAVTEVIANEAVAPKPAALAIELALAASLLALSRRPLAVLVAVSLLQVIEAAVGVPLQEPVVPLLASVLATYALVVRASLRRTLVGAAVLLAAICVETVVQHKGFGNVLFAVVFCGASFAVARTVAHRTRHAVRLQAQAAELELRRERDARQAAEAERVRIARELHDVIAHSVSVMVVQAGAAERVLASEPVAAAEALRAVQTTGRQAISELARLLGILREADDAAAEEIGLAPQPGVEDISALVRQSAVAGLPVQVHVEGEQVALAPGVELAVYRVVQEALTNVRKHAAGASASVRLRYGASSIAVEIANSGDGSRTPSASGGHGLIGMRERVGIYGGQLRAGHTQDGGYQVLATIPTSVAR